MLPPHGVGPRALETCEDIDNRSHEVATHEPENWPQQVALAVCLLAMLLVTSATSCTEEPPPGGPKDEVEQLSGVNSSQPIATVLSSAASERVGARIDRLLQSTRAQPPTRGTSFTNEITESRATEIA